MDDTNPSISTPPHTSNRRYSLADRFIEQLDRTLRTLSPGQSVQHRATPRADITSEPLTETERRHAAGLMRVNHTGEVCAQALYQGQSLTAKLPNVRTEMEQAANEEIDHLHWCAERLDSLGAHSSILNPAWYGLSFGMGAVAGLISDETSLGFVAATEELVCAHLEEHLDKLPANDLASRAVVTQMIIEEKQHGDKAIQAGGKALPDPVKWGMRMVSKVMTKTTYHI